MITKEVSSFYAAPGPMTDVSEHADWLSCLPSSVVGLVEVVQGLLLHIFWADRYGVSLTEEREQEVQIRRAGAKLDRVRELNGSSPLVPRPLNEKLVGNCRDFSVMLTALLRHKGIPARARCGFGRYFAEGQHMDHWICEVWDDQQQRWRRVDAQLDDFQCNALDIEFDPLDMPEGQFLSGGEAWRLCRTGEANPDTFGIFDMHGLWFVRSNLVRDLASLNKLELLPWDCWGLVDDFDDTPNSQDMALADRVAGLRPESNEQFAAVRQLYETEPQLHVPATIRSYLETGVEEVELL